MENTRPNLERPSVFISYSHDSEENSERVLGLTASLTRDGCDCRLDVHKDTDEDWPSWMTLQLIESDFVLCVCTETYHRRFRDNELPDVGLGVGWEAPLIRRMLYSKKLHNASVFPVLFESKDRQNIPIEMVGYDSFLLNSTSSAGYTSLLRKLLDCPEYEKPKRGPRPILETKKVAAVFERPNSDEFIVRGHGQGKRSERGRLRDLNRGGSPPDPTVPMSELTFDARADLGEESFRNWEGWDVCGPLNEVSLDDLQVHKHQGDPQYFYEIPDFTRLKELLAERRNVLIRGAPSAGKTRMAFEAMQSQSDCWFLFVKPMSNETSIINDVFERVPRLPDSVPHAFLFYDDYEKYGAIQDYSHVIAGLGRKRVSVVITLRSDPEFSQARKTFKQSLTILPTVEIQPLNKTIAEEVSQDAGIDDRWQEGFDGTIGWILLGPRVKQAIFNSWKNDVPQRIILCVCRLLRACGTYEYFEKEIRELCESVFQLPIDDNTWRTAIANLDGQNFLVNGKDDVFQRQRVEVYDALLDKVVQFELDHSRLVSYLRHWSERNRLDRLVALQGSSVTRESGGDLVRSALADCIENEDKAVYHHLVASTLVGLESRRNEEIIERERAAELEPTGGLWAYSLAVRLMDMNDAKAERWMQTAIRMQPNSEWEELLGDYLIRQKGRTADAIAAYRRALILDDNNCRAKWKLAVALASEDGHASEACELAIEALDGHISFDVPRQLANISAYLDAWLDSIVRKLVLGETDSWIYDEIQQAVSSIEVDNERLENTLVAAIEERMASLNSADEARALSDSLRELTRSFEGKRSYRGISRLAGSFLEKLGEDYQHDDKIASDMLSALTERVSALQDARELLKLHFQAHRVFRRFDTSQVIREMFIGFLGGAVFASGRLNMPDEVKKYHEEIESVAQGHLDDRELREISSDVIEVQLEIYAEKNQFDKVEDCLENLKGLCMAYDDQDYLRYKWAAGIVFTIESQQLRGHAKEVERLLAVLQSLSIDHADDGETQAIFARALESGIAVNAGCQNIEKAREHQATLEKLAARYPSEVELQMSQIRTLPDSAVYPLHAQREIVESCLTKLNGLLEAKPELDELQRVGYWCEALSSAAWVYAKCKELERVGECLTELAAWQDLFDSPELRHRFASGLNAGAMAVGDKAPQQLQQYLTSLSNLATAYPDEPCLLGTLAHTVRNLAVTAIDERRLSDWHRYESLLASFSLEWPNEESVHQSYAEVLLTLIESSLEMRSLEEADVAMRKLSELALQHNSDSQVRSAQCSGMASIVIDLGEADCSEKQESVLLHLRQVADEYSDETGPRGSLAAGFRNALIVSTTKKNTDEVMSHLSVLEGIAKRWPDEITIKIVLAESLADAASFFVTTGVFEQVSEAYCRLKSLAEEFSDEVGISEAWARVLAQFSWEIGAEKQVGLLDSVRRDVSDLLAIASHRSKDTEILCRIAEANLQSWDWLVEHRENNVEDLRATGTSLYLASQRSNDPGNMSWGISTAAELLLLCRDFKTAYLWISEALNIVPDGEMDELSRATALCGLDDFDAAEPLIQKALNTFEDTVSLKWFDMVWNDLWPNLPNQRPEIVRMKSFIRDRRNELLAAGCEQ